MSFMPGFSRPPGPRQLQGTKPGLLDPMQSSRLLRTPNSALSFAAFDPLVASVNSVPQRKHNHDPELARPKRIVIETTPGSRTPAKWRFVPRARRAPGVEDEGAWPRLVSVCGEPVIMSEDQWDIYKLDPAYDCFVPPHPNHPSITRKDPQPPESLFSRASSTFDHTKKRRFSTPPFEGEDHPSNLNKKFRTVVSLVTSEEESDIEEVTESDEEDEVEEIVIEEDEPPYKAPPTSQNSERVKQRRRTREERVKERREKTKVKTGPSFESTRCRTPEIVDLTMDDSTPEATRRNDVQTQGPTKRKVFTRAESPQDTSPREYWHQPKKRARTQSPRLTKADLNRKRAERERRRIERMNGLKQYREQRLWEEVFSESPFPTPPPSQHASQHNGVEESRPPNANQPQADDDDARRRAEIEESRRKLAELEKDRPVWEENARRRTMEEQMEEEARRLRKEEERLRAAEATAQAEQQRRRAEAAAVEAERRANAETQRIQQEREERRRKERERWSYGPWTNTRAIERYKMLSEEFDTAKFTPENPVDFELVPWPVLESPLRLTPEDIDWTAVEDFFKAARRYMRSQDYKVFVEKSHKRFHPDRWRARGVLKSVADEHLRGLLEVAANTVAQALTPIWREMKG